VSQKVESVMDDLEKWWIRDGWNGNITL